MVVIKNYITEDDGTTTVVIKGVELDNKTSLLLDNGYEVEVDVRVVDPFKITDKQRRKVFALCNDIECATGQPRDYMTGCFITISHSTIKQATYLRMIRRFFTGRQSIVSV